MPRTRRPVLLVALLCLSAAFATAALGASGDTGPVPLQRAHAHNDYEHPRPLLDALEHGFTSVEADVHLVDGELLVAHDPEDLEEGRTLESLYLAPLRERARAHDGSVYPDGTPFTLLVDVKTDAEATYRVLHRQLRRYREILTTAERGAVRPKAVTAIVSGNRALELMQRQQLRFAFHDGRLSDLGSGAPASLIPLISDNWTVHFDWAGRGPMPDEERRKLHDIVATAHADGQRVRFWATPDMPIGVREAVWHELIAAEVDLVNTDDLAGLEAFLLANDPSVGPSPDDLTTRFEETGRDTVWERVGAVDLGFDAFHPQGMTKVGEDYYLSSVEILEPTERYPEPRDGYDRSPGAGVGHLFKVDAEGRLLADLVLGEGVVYHPGGIDYDGESIWVPVAEYRPDSSAIVYRVDPVTMTAEEAFRASDHIGGVVADPEHERLIGLSWGSRTFYRWNERGALDSSAPNESGFVDYQDCQLAGTTQMLCGGVAELPGPGDVFPLGGLALVDLNALTVGHEVPVLERSDDGSSITGNPVLLEMTDDGLSLTAVPDDGEAATLYRYETTLE